MPQKQTLSVDRDRRGDIVRIDGYVEWRIQPADGGCCVGICDSLNLTLQTDTWPEMVTEAADATKWLLSELCEGGELDQFLSDRGWKAHGQPRPGTAFDIPICVVAADQHVPATAVR